MKLIIIGMGGIGSHLVYPLFQYLNYVDELGIGEVMLVDGDKYEEKNKSRQLVSSIGMNKAVSSRDRYTQEFPKLRITADPRYVNEENIEEMVDDGDIVLLCVDNNKTRMLLQEYAIKLNNLIVISGGNELYDGDVQFLVKRKGVFLTPTFTEKHPEIASGSDKHPDELSCEELSTGGAPQISIVNAAIADAMRRVLFAYFHGGVGYHEVFINTATGNLRVEKTSSLIQVGQA